MQVYFDNAASTPLDENVLQEMSLVMKSVCGNPSSIHTHGRQARTLLEKARKTIATLLQASPSEIVFTSGGTEADNMAISCSINDFQIKHAITSSTEHQAVIHTLEALHQKGIIKLSFVNVDRKGNVDLEHLEELLKINERSLVSLMHANNEIGTLTDIIKVGDLCEQYKAIFHCDTVQSMGHYPYDLTKLKVHFLVGSAHKLHGPKGVGFLYINPTIKIKPILFGGSQERDMRGGTENLYGIIGLAKALEIAYHHIDKHQQYIQGLKSYMQKRLIENIPGVTFNGETDPKKSLYTILNVSFPRTDMGDMLLFSLDIAGISASNGSACCSGTAIGSHVLRAIGADLNKPSVRFSFSRYNTKEEIDFVIEKIKDICLIKV